MRSNRGFTLIELTAVLFVLGLVLWLAAPRLSAFFEPDRNATFRNLSAASEAAFETALFAKKEVRLVIDAGAGTYLFRREGSEEPQPAQPFGKTLRITGIRVDGEDRLLAGPVEISYLPGGIIPDVRIFVREEDREGGADWTLRLSQGDGAFDVLEGTVVRDD